MSFIRAEESTLDNKGSWISVEDRLPPNYHEVLYFAVIKNNVRTVNSEIMTGHRTHNNEWTHCCLFYSTQILRENVTVTHWMELPEPPEFVNSLREKECMTAT